MSLVIVLVIAGLVVVGLAKFLYDEIRHDREEQGGPPR